MKLRDEIQDNMPDFANNCIKLLHRTDLERIMPFVETEYHCSNHSMNVFDVAGTMDETYLRHGRTWLESLHFGPRMGVNLRRLEENPDYYFADEIKTPPLEFIRLDGDTYVGKDGSHRLTIAKFLFWLKGRVMLHGVNFVEYRVNRRLKHLFDRLELEAGPGRQVRSVRVGRTLLRREDGPGGWRKDHFKIRIEVTRAGGEIEEVNEEQAWELAGRLKRERGNPFRKILGL